MTCSPIAPIKPDLDAARERDLQVIELDFHRDPRWEAFVNSHPNALIYHHPTWLEVLEREYGRKCVSLACVNAAGVVKAILPLFYTIGLPLPLGGFLATRRLSSLPRTPLAGPLALEPWATTLILQEAKRLADSDPNLQLEVKLQEPLADDVVSGLARTQWRESYLLSLPGDPGKLRFGSGAHHRRLKWAVNKAIKNGLICREAQTEEELWEWYQLYLQRMGQNVVPARPYRLFVSLWELMRPKGMMRLMIVDRPGVSRRIMVAGSIFFMFHETVSYAFNGSRTQDMWLCPNDLLHWHHIHRSCGEGFRAYDFGEVPEEHPELALFKSKWGADPIRLHRYYYPTPPEREATSTNRSLRKLAGAAWRHLPLKVTAYLGDKLYSYL
jgi:hypothetical protein